MFLTDQNLRTVVGLLAARPRGKTRLEVREIGTSRTGGTMYGFVVGEGKHHVSITAGAHADEPVGPMTARMLIELFLSGAEDARQLTSHFTFYICPQVNPDGSAANEAWFHDPINEWEYLQHVVREPPGDDIEFGYPDSSGRALRPENEAVAAFLREGGPYVYHASLHGMAYAEGAWFLIGKEWASRTGELQRRLTAVAERAGLPLHDIDRRGDKGFTRIAHGFCTTPTSVAMREHFHSVNDPATAALFHPSSMEFVQSLGGDPLVMVSELPLFLIGRREPAEEGCAPPPGTTAFEKFRAALPEMKARAERGDRSPLKDLLEQYDVRALDISTQVQVQGAMVLESVKWLAETKLS